MFITDVFPSNDTHEPNIWPPNEDNYLANKNLSFRLQTRLKTQIKDEIIFRLTINKGCKEKIQA
jgi:hypothetical protein